jgi:hypothetical protein
MGGRQRKPRSTRMGRFLRGRRLDDNPLRRASDRAETLVLIVLAAVFLTCAPLAAPASGAWAHAMAQRAELAQAASMSQVTAVVVSTPTPPVVGYGEVVSTAKARWTAPDGAVMTGMVPVTVGTGVGAKLRMWTTRDGRPAVQPLSNSQVASLTVLGEVTGVAALAAALALAGVLARWSLNRRRLAGWDADWQSTEPRWTTRA